MKLSHIKRFRVSMAIVFWVSTAVLFLDLWDTGVSTVAGELLFLQVVPSLLNFLNHGAVEGAGFMIVLLITLVFGRIYCSAICPLGIFQDMIARLFSKKTPPGKQRYRYAFSPPFTVLRYTILCLTILTFMLGSGLILNLLDPFSSFGRILAHVFRPIAVAVNNLAVPLTDVLGVPALFLVQWPVLAPVSLGVALAALGLLGWMSARHGRLCCNTICPVGTLLGLVSKVSLVRIGIDTGACKSCGQCMSVCKAGCIDVKTKQVDISRCVACFNCLSACPGQAMTYKPGRQPAKMNVNVPAGRRGFMLALAAGAAGMASTRLCAQPNPLPAQARPTTIPEKRTCPISPPGSVGIDRYTGICTACHLCVCACPSRVLVPSMFSFGLSGVMQPKMDFSSGHCNYDCTVCSQVCPTNAIQPLSTQKKRQTQVGTAKFIKENCVVYTDQTNCGACSEHCPTKAVHMVPYLNVDGRKLVIPQVNEAICVGCGGCEHACPTRPYKAIYVDGNPVHRVADKPLEQKLDADTGKDFPF